MYKRAQLSVLPQQIWKGTVPLLHDKHQEHSLVADTKQKLLLPLHPWGMTRRATSDTIYL